MSKSFQIILASTSPRRSQLLNAVGLSFKVQGSHVDETVRRGEKPRALVRRLARSKALAVAQSVRRGKTPLVVIAADTTVVHPSQSKVLNKPESAAEAKKMLRAISGRTHQVLTGYCLVALGEKNVRRTLTRVVSTQVTMRKLSAHEISQYVASGEPMDKAGAYAAQGTGMTLISSIRGSYTNVVGLPVAELLNDLKELMHGPWSR